MADQLVRAQSNLSKVQASLARALDDLESAAAEEGNLFVQDCPRVHQALKEVRAAKGELCELGLALEENKL